jgi:hypothetical protein
MRQIYKFFSLRIIIWLTKIESHSPSALKKGGSKRAIAKHHACLQLAASRLSQSAFRKENVEVVSVMAHRVPGDLVTPEVQDVVRRKLEEAGLAYAGAMPDDDYINAATVGYSSCTVHCLCFIRIPLLVLLVFGGDGCGAV